MLSTRGLSIPNVCPLCNEGIETITHALRDCREAQVFWNSLAPPLSSSLFYESGLKDWLKINCCCPRVSSLSNISWGTMFAFSIWSLWIRRNNFIFRNERQPCNLRTDAIARATKFAFLESNGKLTCAKSPIKVSWIKPPLNWHKLISRQPKSIRWRRLNSR